MVKVEIKGREKLSEEESNQLDQSVDLSIEKISRELKDLSEIDITIKTYHNEGHAHQYSLNVEVKSKLRNFSADAIGWQFNVVLKDVFDKVLTQIKHFIENRK